MKQIAIISKDIKNLTLYNLFNFNNYKNNTKHYDLVAVDYQSNDSFLYFNEIKNPNRILINYQKGADIKLIAFDVYGVILPSFGIQKKRTNVDCFFDNCKNKNLILTTVSDAKLDDLLIDFKDGNINQSYFEKLIQIDRKTKNFVNEYKNFQALLDQYPNIKPNEILVFGDRFERDFLSAKNHHMNSILVPEYKTVEDINFDFSKIDIEFILNS